MSLFSIFARNANRGQRGATHRRQHGRRPLQVERLEDRLVPSTVTVTSALDSGTGSLRAALAAAASGDTIVFSRDLRGHTIALTSGPLAITKDVSIAGPGAARLTVSGNDSRVFDIASGVTADLSGLTITHGSAAAGGAIDNAGNLTVRDNVLVANQSSGGKGGGAILNEAGATLSLDNDLLSNNTASTNVGADVFGGALLNEGTATISDSTFSGNKALGGGAVDFFAGSVGGAIDNFGGRLVVTGSTFLDNQAISAGGGPYGGIGGAIESNSGFDQTQPASADISNSSFVGNLVTGGDGANGNGGAIDNEGAGTVMHISGSTFLANRSVGGPNGQLGAFGEGLGGALMNIFGTLTVDHSTLIANQAIGGDHGTSATTNPPTGSGQGGGMVNAGGTLIVTDSLLAGNQALGGNTDAGPGGVATGGAISNWGTALVGTPGILTVSNSTLLGNVASAGRGGPDNGTTGGFAAGGAIDDSFSGTAFVMGSTLVGNEAVGGTGGAGVKGGTGLGGAIAVGFSTLFGLVDNSTLQVTDSSIEQNTARGGTGGPHSNGGEGLGGGIAITAGSSATLAGTTVAHNLALGGARGLHGQAGHGMGGGVYNLGSFAADLAGSIAHNRASTSNDNVFP